MAYNPYNLSVLAYANSFTLWHYKTDDSGTVVKKNGYFNKASNMLRRGDIILINTSFNDEDYHHAVILLVAQSIGNSVKVVSLS